VWRCCDGGAAATAVCERSCLAKRCRREQISAKLGRSSGWWKHSAESPGALEAIANPRPEQQVSQLLEEQAPKKDGQQDSKYTARPGQTLLIQRRSTWTIDAANTC